MTELSTQTESLSQVISRHPGEHLTIEGERSSSMSLVGRTALVTGVRYVAPSEKDPNGLRNIGTAIGERLAIAGANVIVHGNAKREAEMENYAKLLQSMGVQVEVATGNLALPETSEKFAEIARDKFDGILDILVNNAAVSPNTPFAGHTDKLWKRFIEKWTQAIEVNLNGTMYTTLALLESIKAAPTGRGRIINISSIVGTDGHANQMPYGMTKGGINGMTLCLANELAPEQINVNALALGAVKSKIWAPVVRYMSSIQSAEDKADKVDPLTPIMQKTPLLGGDRFMTPEEAAAPVAWLASDNGRTATGQIYKVEAGILRLAME